jgi:hypothetical protein
VEQVTQTPGDVADLEQLDDAVEGGLEALVGTRYLHGSMGIII